MNELNKLIEQLIKEKGGTKQQYLHLLKEVARHESGGTFDPKLQQTGRRGGSGPGVGLYQFERGKNAGGITAAKRTRDYYKKINKSVPKWLEKASTGDDLDVSNLTPEQQDVLFLGNMREHPKADLGKIWKGEQSIPEFWANYHWAGAKKDRNARIENFKGTFEEYKNDYVAPEFKKEQLPIAQDNTKVVIPEQQVPQNYNAKHQVVNQLPDAPRPIVEGGNMQNLIQYIQGQKDKYSTNQNALGGNIDDNGTDPIKKDKGLIEGVKEGLQKWNPNNWDLKKRLNKVVANNVTPYGTGLGSPSWEIDNTKLADIWDAKYSGKINSNNVRDSIKKYVTNIKTGKHLKNNESIKPYRPSNINASYDALNIHQGVPQKYNSFIESKYKPSKSDNPNSKYYELTGTARDELIRDLTSGKNKGFKDSNEKELYVKNSTVGQGSLKNFKYSKGNDEKGEYISYYDINNYDNILDKIGTPFEIYGRVYTKDINKKAYGGDISPDNSNLYRRNFNSFGAGGTHEQNPNGGVPLGIGANGKRNTVEQKESAYNFKEGKFIFSNRIKI